MSRYVPGRGDPGAKIVFVGEAPGADEAYYGKPFVGVSGQELCRMAAEAGINVHDCYFTNVLRFQPPGNKIEANVKRLYKTPAKNKPFFDAGMVPFRGKVVSAFVPQHYKDLMAELEAINPNVVVPLGSTALWALTGEEGITSWRASLMHSLDEVNGRRLKVIPTYHPAAILRQWSWRSDLVQDLRRILRESETPEVVESEWNFFVRPSFATVVGILQSLLDRVDPAKGGEKSITITCDIETRVQQIACIGIGWSKLDALCIPLMCVEGKYGYWSEGDEREIMRMVKAVLTHPRINVQNQNYTYDAFYLYLWYGIWSIPEFDTMIAQNVLYPGKEKALAYLASIHCEHYRYWKEDGREWSKSMNEEILWRYNCMDCCNTFEVAESLEDALHSWKVWEPFQMQMSLFEPTLKMMFRGVDAPADKRLTLSKDLHKAIEERQHWLDKCFGHPINPRSPVQLKKLFYVDFKLKPVLDRKTRRPTLNDKALEILKKREPLLTRPIEKIQQIRTLGIFKKTFVEAPGPLNKFYCGFNIAGTSTFRFSSASNPIGFGTNLQNVPKVGEDSDLPSIRKLFVPPPGWRWVRIDLSKADLRVVAWEADEHTMKQQLAEGIDPYVEAAKVVRMPYKRAKMFCHGTHYGGKPRTMAANCKLTVHEAEVAQKRYLQARPGISLWQRRIAAQMQEQGWIRNAFGYKRVFFTRIGDSIPEGLAWIPQSTVAITINKILLNIDRTFPVSQVRLLLQVHDELDMLVWQDDFKWLAPLIRKEARVVIPYPDPLVIPHAMEVSDKSWGEVEEYND